LIYQIEVSIEFVILAKAGNGFSLSI